jgi:hypothetical protein
MSSHSSPPKIRRQTQPPTKKCSHEHLFTKCPARRPDASGFQNFSLSAFQLFSFYPKISAGPPPGKMTPRADRIYARREKKTLTNQALQQ